MLLFVDTQNDNASIFSYDITKKEYKPLVRRRSYENIQGLAFDPVTRKLFWTDTNEKSIYWKSLKPGSKNDTYGNLLIKMDDEVPRAITVDSCRGYIYWTNINITKPTIERARLDGSERTVILNSANIYKVVSIAIDQNTKKLYWIDDKEGIHYSIESSDLDGKNQKKLLAGTNHMPNTITVSKDYLYWVDLGYRSVWKLPKNPSPNEEPEDIINFSNVPPFGIVANYKITDQIVGVSECDELSSIAENKTVINDIFTIPSDVGLFCLHGVKVEGVATCKCSTGYIGERCEISVCHNFCLQGDCSATANGEPVCKCKTGYTGARCDVNICEGHCLNYGTCSVGIDQKPTCKCSVDFEGDRCEIVKAIPVTTTTVPMEHCNCTNENKSALLSTSDTANSDVYVEACNSWDPIRDPVIIVLGTIAGLLFVACAVLVMKVLRLRKRPRIKRRIIVNKNVTPLTARPDQCEITIENCCNMNICETDKVKDNHRVNNQYCRDRSGACRQTDPCFEPRNTIRPNLLNGKPGKEEKRNLIANMENPDDPY
ncbi:Protein cueball [Papilio machaon]|uniref:Protein cueball n=1 Tax=Papilio machaon TaxID=76193 RepID=A0A0N1PF81_PAPMA|nr:Protein cueball [Papilio machaon]